MTLGRSAQDSCTLAHNANPAAVVTMSIDRSLAKRIPMWDATANASRAPLLDFGREITLDDLTFEAKAAATTAATLKPYHYSGTRYKWAAQDDPTTRKWLVE